MTVALKLFSEPFPEAGGSNAETQQKAFGKFDLTSHEVFVRETVQNSWDARVDRGPQGSIDFAVDWVQLTATQRAALSGRVFEEIPPELDQAGKLGPTLRAAALDMLVVSDRGTRGLAGPLRSNVAVPKGTRTDFRDFVRNLGRDASKELGGGTFGIGKAVLYTSSAVRTVVIYSQTHDDQGRVEPRLIAVAADSGFARDGNNYTGRHFWGDRAGGSPGAVVDPLRGEDARALALELNLTELGPAETGTSIALLAPSFDGLVRDAREEMQRLARAAAKWTWPHLLHEDQDGHASPTIKYRFRVDGAPIPVPDPDLDDELQHYALAYRALIEKRRNPDYSMQLAIHDRIESKRPARRLGDLMQIPAPAGIDDNSSGARIALMRGPKFIVKYMDVTVPVSTFRSRGVFVADAGMEDQFALSEPPAHDDWKPANVKSDGRSNLVKIALDQIQKAARSMPGAHQPEAIGEAVDTLPQLAREFGALLGGSAGSGAGIRAQSRGGKGGPGGGARGVKVGLTGEVDYIEDLGIELAEFAFSIDGAPPADAALTATAWIAIGEESHESTLDSSFIHGWATAAGAPIISTGTSVPTSLLPDRRGVVRVKLPPGAAVGVSLAISEVELG